jgi:hypothetical protein
MNRFDLHIIINILIGMLIGGALVYGMTDHEIAGFRTKVGDLSLRVEYLERAADADAKILYGDHQRQVTP